MSTNTVENNLTFKEIFVWLWRFWGELKAYMWLLLILTPIAMWFRSYTPLIISNIVDELEKTSPDSQLIKDKIILFAVLGVVHLVLYVVLQSLRGVINFKLENNFRLSLFQYIINLGQSFYQRFSTGDLITRLVDDVSEKKLAWFACSGIFRFYEALIKVVQCLYFMFYISPFLSFITVIPLTFIVWFYINFSTKTIEYSKKNQKSISELNSFLNNSIDGIRIIKSYNQEKKQEVFFANLVENQKQKSIDLVKASSIIELSYQRLSEIAIIVVFLFGGWQVIKQEISIGELMAFNLYIFMLIWPMMDIGQFFIKGRGAGVSVQRIKELENYKPDILNSTNPIALDAKPTKISFKNVSYTFPNGSDVLHNLSFEVEAGQCVAIAGGVGSGKSTFINFLPRIIDPKEGEVMINGFNIKDYDLYQLRKLVGFVPQNPSLFSESIRENIIFGREKLSEEDLKRAISIAQLDKEIEGFPQKEQTIIGQRGVMLSGGQKQRVAIARAIIERPEILILDDCTSALDAETESRLWNGLYDYMPGITVFLITHRVNTLKKADKVVFVEAGKISDIGTHDELMQKSSAYKKLYSSED